MNALVADQMSRLRELLGSPKTATKFLRNGYGRFPQFGMYTGRSEFHGWYSEEVETKIEGGVRRKNGNARVKPTNVFLKSSKTILE